MEIDFLKFRRQKRFPPFCWTRRVWEPQVTKHKEESPTHWYDTRPPPYTCQQMARVMQLAAWRRKFEVHTAFPVCRAKFPYQSTSSFTARAAGGSSLLTGDPHTAVSVTYWTLHSTCFTVSTDRFSCQPWFSRSKLRSITNIQLLWHRIKDSCRNSVIQL